MSGALPPIDPPVVERPDVPTYGIPETIEGALPWSWAAARLAAAETYWVATTRPDGGIWAVTPDIVFGWSSFPADATRWRFGGAAGPPTRP
ncbi:MAG TPA: hypothetical protein VIK16_07230 [Candidatus Limnocylindrales bacterium]